MSSNLVNLEYYNDEYKGIHIADEEEFNTLSARAEEIIDTVAKSEVVYWVYDRYEELKNESELIKKAICQEIEVLYQSNGMQAVTGGADAGIMEIFGGVPLAKTAKQNVIQMLAKNGLWYKGI